MQNSTVYGQLLSVPFPSNPLAAIYASSFITRTDPSRLFHVRLPYSLRGKIEGSNLLSSPRPPMEEALSFPSSKITTPSSSFRLRCPSLNSLRLRRIFDLFDKNCDGVLTLQELNQALTLLGLDPDLSDLDSIISSFIQPGGPGLRFEDFSALHQSLNKIYFDTQGGGDGGEDQGIATSPPVTLSQEDSDLSEAFKVFDEDGDGYISAKELQVVLRKLGFSEGNEIDRVEKMIISIDRNHDGRVDFLEFKDMMRSVIVRS